MLHSITIPYWNFAVDSLFRNLLLIYCELNTRPVRDLSRSYLEYLIIINPLRFGLPLRLCAVRFLCVSEQLSVQVPVNPLISEIRDAPRLLLIASGKCKEFCHPWVFAPASVRIVVTPETRLVARKTVSLSVAYRSGEFRRDVIWTFDGGL